MSARAATAALLCILAASVAWPACAQTPPTAEEMQALRTELEQPRAEERERAARIDALERRLDAMSGEAATVATAATSAPTETAHAASDATAAETLPSVRYPTEQGDRYASVAPDMSFGAFTPGRGFTVANTPHASLNIGAYGLFRYLNQMPGDETSFIDHLAGSKISIRATTSNGTER